MSNTVISNESIVTYGYSCLVSAESYKMHAYSAFTLLFMVNRGTDPKVVRSKLAGMAARTGVIAENTWQSYVKGVEVAASKLYDNLTAEVTVIRSLDLETAVDEVRKLYEAFNVVTGSDIRDWSKCEGFEPLDKAGAKAAKAAKAKAAKAAKDAADLDAWLAKPVMGDAPAAVAVEGVALDPVAAIIAALSTLTMAQRQDVLAGLNGLLTTDAATGAAALAAAPAPDAVAPVLADDATVSPASTLAAHFNRKAA